MGYTLLILLQSLIFALIDVFAKIALQTVDIWGFLALRFGIAACAGFLIYGKKIVSDLKKTSPTSWFIPAICIGLSINISNIALKLTTATSYSFMRNMAALIAPLMMCLLKRRKYRFYDLILQTTLVLGLYLLCAKGGLNGFGWGEVIGICTAFLVASSLVFGADSVKAVSSQTLSVMQLCSGLIFSTIFGLASGSFAVTDFSLYLQPKIAGILLFNALIGTLIGYQLQNIALKKITSNAVGMLQSSYPIFTAAVAHFLLGESLSPVGTIGAVLITGCVVAQSALKDR